MKQILEQHQQKQDLLELIEVKFDYIKARMAAPDETTENKVKLTKDHKLAEKMARICKFPNSKEGQEFKKSCAEQNLKFGIDWKSEGVPRLDQLNNTRKIQAGLLGLINQQQTQRG